MRRTLLTAVGVAALSLAPAAYAADHLDGPSATQGGTDLSGDITDVYAFSDANNVNLIMDVGANATAGTTKFSNAVKYVFHVNAGAAFGDTSPAANTIICTFDATQKISCWLQNGSSTVDYVTGDASATAGIKSQKSMMTVFAGVREDPFFFNIQGFRHVTTFAAQNQATIAGLPSQNGCPMLDAGGGAGLSATVRQYLKSKTDGTTPGVDDFAKGGTAAAGAGVPTLTGNVLALVISVNKSALTQNGAKPVLGVWASTHK